MRTGLPYQGGKSKLAEWIIDLFPKATHFYDLFAGGCSISHAALLSGKFEHVHANDITDSVKLFEDALNGDLNKYEPERFRTREDFFAEKDTNPFARIVYSFGNNQADYLYSREIEPYKKAVHEMLYAPTVNERRLKFKSVIREMERLGVLTCGRADRTNCAVSLRKEAKSPPPILTHIQHLQATNWIVSADCSPKSGQNK